MYARSLLVMLLLLSLAAVAHAQALDLLAGLNSGQLYAEFRGAGDRAVTGTIGRTGDTPLDVNIPPGTQFWAQAGGRQGQSTFGNSTFGLREEKEVQVTLATCCTNLGLPEATAADTMVAVACPDARLARLMSLPGISDQPHAAIQVAVWAIANNPRVTEVRRVLRKEPGGTDAEFVGQTIALAAELVRQAGLQPQDFRVFR